MNLTHGKDHQGRRRVARLRVVELPDLDLSARTFEDIPAVVSGAAARLTGRSEHEFSVVVGSRQRCVAAQRLPWPGSCDPLDDQRSGGPIALLHRGCNE